MISKNIFLTAIIFVCFLTFPGCIVEKKTTQNSDEVEIVSYKNDMTTEALEHARQMQSLVIRLQDENAILKERNQELIMRLEALQAGGDINGAGPEEQLNSEDLTQKYIKLMKDNYDLRKLVKYERGLREDLMKRIEQDQITIKELKSRLGE
jgi:hypothetical protein